MGSEKFCLRWNDFESNISSAFRELRDDKDFFDITLACDDEQIQAHKVILSACSPFFRNVLRRNPHQHPLLYLKGVKFTDLQSVLNFMYHGEVNVAQEELNSFLSVAEDLKVKGLTQNQPQERASQQPSVQKPAPAPQIKSTPRPPDKRSNVTTKHHPPSYTIDNDDIEEIVPPVKSEPSDTMVTPSPIIHHQPSASPQDIYSSQPVTQALAHPEDQDMSMTYQEEDYGEYETEQDYAGNMNSEMGTKGQSVQDPSDLLQFVGRATETSDLAKPKYTCTLCNKFSHLYRTNVRNHVESKHFTNMFSYECEYCGQTFSSKNALQLHRSRVHKNK